MCALIVLPLFLRMAKNVFLSDLATRTFRQETIGRNCHSPSDSLSAKYDSVTDDLANEAPGNLIVQTTNW